MRLFVAVLLQAGWDLLYGTSEGGWGGTSGADWYTYRWQQHINKGKLPKWTACNLQIKGVIQEVTSSLWKFFRYHEIVLGKGACRQNYWFNLFNAVKAKKHRLWNVGCGNCMWWHWHNAFSMNSYRWEITCCSESAQSAVLSGSLSSKSLTLWTQYWERRDAAVSFSNWNKNRKWAQHMGWNRKWINRDSKTATR